MDNFNLLKLKRALWLADLEDENINDAVKNYEKYLDKITKYKGDKNLIKSEIDYSKKLFSQKLISIADKYYEDKNYWKAIRVYDTIIAYEQNNVPCIKNSLNELKQYDLAESLLNILEEIDDNIDKYIFAAQTYEKQKEYKKSVEYVDKYMDKKGNNATTQDYNIQGYLYDLYYSEITHKREDIEKSLKAFEIASDMDTNERLYAKNATIMAGKGNNYQSGKKYWDRLFKINTLTNDDKYDFAGFSLKNSDFDNWHKYFGARFAKENNATYFPKINKPEWNGIDDLSDKTLLIHCEQGFGDTFLTWGYIPRIINKVKRIIFVVQKEIFELYKNNDWGVEIYSRDNLNLDKIDYDYYIPSMSLLIVLKLNRENISVGEGYIKVDNKRVEEFKNKYFNNDKFKIGISFSGSATGNHTRDIGIQEYLPLDELKNVQIYNLTKDVEDRQFDIFTNNKVVNIVKNCNNFADTAAAIKNCDIVLTADNCILNLAGGLGVKTCAIFNWTYEYRWFDLKGDNVVWYTCVKPYVADDIDNWSSAVIPAVEDIKKLIH